MTFVIQRLIDALSVGSTYALLALGVTLVYSVMNLVNFAYGMLLVWSGYIAVVLINNAVPVAVTVVVSIFFAMFLSIIVGRVAFVPFIGSPPITLLITSFAVELVLQFAAIWVFSERPQVLQVPAFFNAVFHVGHVRIPSIELVTIAVATVAMGGLYLVLNHTSVGLEARAAAENPRVARLMGVKPNWVLIVVFTMSGAIAGVVGLLWFAKVGAITPEADLGPTLKAFVAVILGGLGSTRGAVVGGLALGGLETLMNAVLSSGALLYNDAIVFTIVIAIFLVRPAGLVGRKVGL